MAENKISKIITNKLLILICGLVIFIFYRITLPEENKLINFPHAFRDVVLLDYMETITIFLSQNLQLRDFTLLMGFMSLDAMMLVFVSYYIKHGNSFKPFICFLFFYGIRAVLQSFYLLDFYPIYLFQYPGFFSFTVPTCRAADFFYSGHTGCAFLLALNFRSWGEKKLFYLGCVVTFIQMYVMTVVRAHYSVDVLFGLLVSHYVFVVMEDYCDIIDRIFPWFVSIKKENEVKFLSKMPSEISKISKSATTNIRQMQIIYE